MLPIYFVISGELVLKVRERGKDEREELENMPAGKMMLLNSLSSKFNKLSNIDEIAIESREASEVIIINRMEFDKLIESPEGDLATSEA